MVELMNNKEIAAKKQETDLLWKSIREEIKIFDAQVEAFTVKYEEQEKQFEDFEQYIRALEGVANKEFGRMRE